MSDTCSDDADTVHVLVPGDYFRFAPDRDWPDGEVLARTIALNLERPETPWFELAAEQACRCAAIMDINHQSTSTLNGYGLPTTFFQVGYTAAWDCWLGEDRERPIDIVYLATMDEQRNRALGSFAPQWYDLQARLLLAEPTPENPDHPSYFWGKAKFELLAASKLTLNMHRFRSAGIEWIRVIEAISNGSVVLSEPFEDSGALRGGEHFIAASLSELGSAAVEAVGDEPRVAKIRQQAYDLVRTQLPMSDSVATLLGIAENLLAAPKPVLRKAAVAVPPTEPRPMPAWPTAMTTLDLVGAGVARVERRLRSMEATRLRAELSISSSSEEVVDAYQTPAYESARPRCTVMIALYNYQNEVVEALESIGASTGIAYEVIIQDDCSTDSSLDAVMSFLAANPDFPGAVRHARVNRGLGTTWNDLLAVARSEYVFVVDADNGVYPSALRRMAEALDTDPAAFFAYAMIVRQRNGKSDHLISSLPWQPSMLRRGNYIDAMAMARKSEIIKLGGWNQTMLGWQDFHLWARVAEAGSYGAFVPQVLSWHRISDDSLSGAVDLDPAGAWAAIRKAAPRIMANETSSDSDGDRSPSP